MIKHWFLIDEKLRFLICADLVMLLRLLVFTLSRKLFYATYFHKDK